jgi:plasmid stabilization system protein ParE
MKLAFTPDAERELTAVIDALFELSPPAAARFAEAFDNTTGRLLTFPYSGPAVDGQFRVAVIGSSGYVLGYQVAGDTVMITSIRHGSRRS